MNTSSLTPLRIGILNGDDMGHEIVPATVEITRAAAALHGVAIEWSPLPIGRIALDTHGHTLPPATLDGWILGPIGHRAHRRSDAVGPRDHTHNRSNDGALGMAASMSRAITEALGDADARTGDIRGRGATRTITQAVLRSLRA